MSAIGIGVFVSQKNDEKRRADRDRQRAADQAIFQFHLDRANGK